MNCSKCGHDKVFHRIGTGNGVPVGKEYCDDRHSDPCSCDGFQTAEPVVRMRLPCEGCGVLHIDEGVFATKPHHTHQCAECGLVWRPAVENTVGVRFLWEQSK